MSAEAPRLVANPRELPGSLVALCVALMAAGAAAFALGLSSDPATAWRAFHVNFLYFGNIAQARAQWLLNNVAGAEQLLEQCAPEHRGWEWRRSRRAEIPCRRGTSARSLAPSTTAAEPPTAPRRTRP